MEFCGSPNEVFAILEAILSAGGKVDHAGNKSCHLEAAEDPQAVFHDSRGAMSAPAGASAVAQATDRDQAVKNSIPR